MKAGERAARAADDVSVALTRGALLKLALIGVMTGAAALWPIEAIEPAARVGLVIFAAAATLWVTELIPPFATAVLVIVLSVYLLGAPGGPLYLDRSGQRSYEMFLNPVASPVLVLFFGGLVLARAATKYGFDVQLARAFITPFGTRPRTVLLGVILTTGVFSMFMSNTASTAMMLAIVMPLAQQAREAAVRKMLVLAVPFAANLGGMGTVIGTPPNAVAVSILERMGQPISFVGWMLVGTPLALGLLIALWLVLLAAFRPPRQRLDIRLPEARPATPALVLVVATFGVTVALWMTEPLHGLPAPVVALLPVAVFTASGIISQSDLKELDWDVLVLVAGGMCLGVTMQASGLAGLLVERLALHQLSGVMVVVLVAVVAVTVSNFMSNTAAANLLIPMVTALPALSPVLGAVGVALACSLAMSLPISTPPNALAYGTRVVASREMIVYGTLVSVLGLAAVLGLLLLLPGVVVGLAARG